VTPLLRHKLMGQRSVFVPGSRMKMNVVPMFLNVFVPWAAFVLCCGISSFWTMYAHPNFAWTCITFVYMFCAFLLFVAVYMRKYDPDPTWFTYTAIAFTGMAIWGTTVGQTNFEHWSKPYYQIQDLKAIHGLDGSFTPGKNVMDGGMFFFNPGNHLDNTRSWHFKYKTNYCVAPIITNTSAPLSMEYSYWAVGKDCCSQSSSDFRCGSWGHLGAAGGIRVTGGEDLDYYRLAVQQAESLYNIMAPAPIFLTWSASPQLEVNSWNEQVFKSFLVMVTFALIASLFLVTMMTCSYSWIGRGASAYANEEGGLTGQSALFGGMADYGTKMIGP